ncbi:MAG: hypothetical protein RIC56_05580 [Pseudomonadales bacterium]
MPQLLIGTGGFLCAVLWMDLMFDVQVWGQADIVAPEILASIAGYYRRVTTDADPMGNLVSLMLLLTVLGSVVQLARTALPLWLRAGAVVTATIPAVAAIAVIVPRAIRLGQQADSPELQSELARSILTGHAWCLVLMLIFVVLQIVAARRLSAAPGPGSP